ncbi:MAG TPA: FKBP-type peptidyl-prolyl cis-trans isomerase [Candidatus Saccharimonadales bacterium]|nr:FKBP-type peptidyl-prolyl cis-trans isomerase [Candidatus Saccharimonadales bacterium]
MTKKRDRIFALLGALFFLVTASTLTIAVVYTAATSKNDKQTTDNTSKQVTPKEGKMLQGTQLKDFTPVSDVTKLQKVDTVVGTGDEVKPGDTVTVDYTGAVAATGVIFQSSLDSGQPISFPLSGVIKGWTEGVPGMKVGGTRRLIIPADMAYGANPPAGSGIPANAPLVFDITLHKIGS